MNDPHVKALHYRVIAGADIDYKKASRLDHEERDFKLTLEGESAIFEMKTHFATEDEARAVVDDFIRCWEIIIGLEQGPGDLQFRYNKPEIVDRAPAPSKPGDVTVYAATLRSMIRLSGSVQVHISRARFPSPPVRFGVSPDVETMYTRYKAYIEGRETLTSMAYVCLTVLETTAAGSSSKARENAARQYSIEYNVLDTLGKLTANKGSAAEARKYPKSGKFAPLTSAEITWLVAAIKMLIRRVGEYAYDPSGQLSELTMAELPPL